MKNDKNSNRIQVFEESSVKDVTTEYYNPSPEYLRIIKETNQRIEAHHRKEGEAYIQASNFICYGNSNDLSKDNKSDGFDR